MSVLSDFLRSDTGRLAMPALLALGIAGSGPAAASVPATGDADGDRPAVSLADVEPALPRLRDDLLFEINEAAQDLAVARAAVGRIAATPVGDGGHRLASAGVRENALAAAAALGGGRRFEDPDKARRRDKLLAKAAGAAGFAAACYFGSRALARRRPEPDDASPSP